jgi:multidrug resistance efflux pump
MNTFYLDKKERVRAWFTPRRRAIVAVLLLATLAVPISHEKVEGPFLLEPAEQAVIRAAVPGSVMAVYADEGQQLASGAPVARLRNLNLESEAAMALADFRQAAARATSAQLQYAGYGPAQRERQRLAERHRVLTDQTSHLQLVSPIVGTVVTPRLRDLVGSYIEAGTTVAEVADLSTMKARLYLPEHELRKIQVGTRASLRCNSLFGAVDGTVVSIAPIPWEIAPGLIDMSKYKGIRQPQFFVLTIAVPNPAGTLFSGMTGTAKVYGKRRSYGARLLEPVVQFLGGKLW